MLKNFIVLGLSVFCAMAAPAQTRTSYAEYLLGPMDVVHIDVQGEDEIEGEYRVTSAGTIHLPFYGSVHVSGLSESEAEEAVSEALGEYLRRPVARVRIKEFNSKPISVLGAVKEPGKLDVPGPISLLNAIIEAGGFSADAGSSLTVVRRAPNGLTDRLVVPIAALEEGQYRYDIPIFSNDIITVSELEPIYVFVQGAVARSGRQEWRAGEPITLTAAIAFAGGPSERASSKVVIRRNAGAGSLDRIRVDYKARPDFLLHSGDVVEVKESFF